MTLTAPTRALSVAGAVPSGVRSASFRSRGTICLLLVALICAAHVIHPAGLAGQVTYLLVTVGAAAAAVIGAQRQPITRRFSWRWIAIGVTLSAVADFVYYLHGWIGRTVGDVTIADAPWLASYVAIAIGLSSLIVGGRRVRRIDVDGLTDIGSFTVLAVIVVTQFGAVRDLVSAPSYPLFTRSVWVAYPILDAALLAVVTQAIISRRLRNRNGLFLSCGVALWLIADFTSLLITDSTLVTRWLDVAWMLGAACLAVAAWPARPSAAHRDEAFEVARVTDARIAITLVPLLVPGVVEIWNLRNGRDANPVPLFAATLVLVALAFIRSARLVKARNRQETALEHSTLYFAALAENSSDAVIVVDRKGRILNEAPNLAGMLGRAGVATTGMDAIELLGPSDRDDTRSMLNRWWLTSGVIADAELQATNADGSHRWFGVRVTNLSADPVVSGMVINLRDITDRKQAEQELSFNAFHDSLTGLANRALFNDRLEHAITRTARTGIDVAVVYLDLDGFKLINDTRGHEAGDRVLREVAARLTGVVRSSDTVSRLGGDEFAILIEGSPRVLGEAETLADRVLQSLTVPFIVGLQHVVLSASIGISVGDIGCTASSMMRDADIAMYRAKTTGKAKWALYEPGMRTAALERLELDSDLHHALDRAQLRLVYQPIIALESNKLVGFEALVRWDHPTLGVVEPDSFVPLAESNGTIVEIGRWVLDEACRTASRWRHTYPGTHLTMAVNLSARQIVAPELVEHVADALERSGFPPDSLILEMTEGLLVQDPLTAARRLQELRALGVRLAIDDFGTGYSSLSYLRQFPIDILKIDRSFTNTITDRSHPPAIVRGLLELAKTLDMETVAEGIELDVQLDSLRDQRCDYGQGFLFAKPLDGDDAALLVDDLQRADLLVADKRSKIRAD